MYFIDNNKLSLFIQTHRYIYIYGKKLKKKVGSTSTKQYLKDFYYGILYESILPFF